MRNSEQSRSYNSLAIKVTTFDDAISSDVSACWSDREGEVNKDAYFASSADFPLRPIPHCF